MVMVMEMRKKVEQKICIINSWLFIVGYSNEDERFKNIYLVLILFELKIVNECKNNNFNIPTYSKHFAKAQSISLHRKHCSPFVTNFFLNLSHGNDSSGSEATCWGRTEGKKIPASKHHLHACKGIHPSALSSSAVQSDLLELSLMCHTQHNQPSDNLSYRIPYQPSIQLYTIHVDGSIL